MFEFGINKYVFWMGFIIGGVVCLSVSELIQLALGTRALKKELKRKNDINEHKERIEPKL
ncbi:hypothetical protein [Acinetobacter variabilis]|uniref:hypothetical protein n=1 Tax=Acinetobacter variabilis TaxID=70346 RepID=UPI002FDCCD3D